MGHVNQVGYLSKTPLNVLEIHERLIDTFESKQQNYYQIQHLWLHIIKSISPKASVDNLSAQ